jgi:hypothetical protein
MASPRLAHSVRSRTHKRHALTDLELQQRLSQEVHCCRLCRGHGAAALLHRLVQPWEITHPQHGPLLLLLPPLLPVGQLVRLLLVLLVAPGCSLLGIGLLLRGASVWQREQGT